MKHVPAKSTSAWTLMTMAGIAAVVVLAGLPPVSASGQVAAAPPSDPYAALPTEMTLQAVVRDFRAANEPGGHPDFEVFSGTRATVGLMKQTLGADGKPVVASLRGSQITTEYLNAAGRIINPSSCDPSLGDIPGVLVPRTSNQITSVSSFSSWYNDTPGVNVSKTQPMVLRRAPGSPVYVFDSAVDSPWVARGGFFPVDGELYGNYGASGHNFHFTTEASASFVYEKGKGHTFKFTGDDDVWVYIGGTQVMDLGGLHPKREQVVELDRLTWLEPGQVYDLRIFHAERRTAQSNFRIETSINFRNIAQPPVTSQWD